MIRMPPAPLAVALLLVATAPLRADDAPPKAPHVPEAVEISKAINAPVQVVWTRADDMRHGFFHSSTVCRMQAGLDAEKKLTVLTHKTASADLSVLGPPALDAKKYADGWAPWGAYDNPYALPAYRSEYVHVASPVRTGPSPASARNAARCSTASPRARTTPFACSITAAASPSRI